MKQSSSGQWRMDIGDATHHRQPKDAYWKLRIYSQVVPERLLGDLSPKCRRTTQALPTEYLVMFEVRHLTSWNEAEPYHREWNDMVCQGVGDMGTPSIFQTFEWNHAWWRAFRGQHELLLLVVLEEGRFAGVAPLMVSRGRFPLRHRLIS